MRSLVFLTLEIDEVGRALALCLVMDIARPELKRQKRRRQIIWAGVAIVLLVAATLGVSRLKPAAPSVERGTVWTDTVKRGPMLRQVRGLGSLGSAQGGVCQSAAG